MSLKSWCLLEGSCNGIVDCNNNNKLQKSFGENICPYIQDILPTFQAQFGKCDTLYTHCKNQWQQVPIKIKKKKKEIS